MSTLPRPLLAVLVVVAACAAAWTLVLRPHGSSTGASSAQVANAFHAAVGASARKPGLQGKSSTGTGSRGAAAGAGQGQAGAGTRGQAGAATRGQAGAATRGHARTSARGQARTVAGRPGAAAQARALTVTTALKAGKVIALLFYNPAGSDDQVDVQRLRAVPGDGGRVVKVAVPVAEISRYSEVVDQVPVQTTPTLLVIDHHHRTQTLTGFADQLAYDQLVKGALAAK